ncbi:MAG: gliding motility-associated protein GldE [Muribaculaceae bacterium]|nr:gliding motility-associated protein GldE [Muribaculaceae bacterium]MDE6487019.1 gliding motility-associated protein GldE [Muribaculaceae bacterium]
MLCSVPAFGVGQTIALVVALLALVVSGFVSGSEIAYFSLTPSQCEELDETPRGAAIRRLLDKPERLLATILIANNLVNVTIVVLCNFALGPVFDGMPPVWSFVLQTVILTFLILLFGEIMPKIYANNYPTQWARFAVAGITFFERLFSPLSGLLVRSSTIVKRVVSKHTDRLTADELSTALGITDVKAGDDKEILQGIIKFGATAASEVMTPRIDITDIDVDMSFDEVMKVVVDSGYSRLPVYAGTQDDIRGVLYSRDLLPYVGREAGSFQWQKLLRKPYFVPESRMIDDLLEDFRKLKIHMAIVVDEFGGTQGLVTMEDVLEEIVGDINDEYDEPDTTYKRLRDDTYVFEGRTLLTDFFRITGLDEDEYKEVTEDAETVAGMLLAIKGDFPRDKEPLVFGRCRFLVLDVTDHRITQVRVKVMPDMQE